MGSIKYQTRAQKLVSQGYFTPIKEGSEWKPASKKKSKKQKKKSQFVRKMKAYFKQKKEGTQYDPKKLDPNLEYLWAGTVRCLMTGGWSQPDHPLRKAFTYLCQQVVKRWDEGGSFKTSWRTRVCIELIEKYKTQMTNKAWGCVFNYCSANKEAIRKSLACSMVDKPVVSEESQNLPLGDPSKDALPLVN